MNKRTFLTFSLRIDATEPLQTVKARVEAALSCNLQGGGFAGVPAFVGEVLGMQIGLLLWRGIGGAYVYQLHGCPDRETLHNVEWDEIRIDRAVIDLLRHKGAGEWRQPTSEEHRAEANYELEDI
jgi:hypothetical protein